MSGPTQRHRSIPIATGCGWLIFVVWTALSLRFASSFLFYAQPLWPALGVSHSIFMWQALRRETYGAAAAVPASSGILLAR